MLSLKSSGDFFHSQLKSNLVAIITLRYRFVTHIHVCVFVTQTVAMLTANSPKPCDLNNFPIIEALSVKFNMYGDLDV